MFSGILGDSFFFVWDCLCVMIVSVVVVLWFWFVVYMCRVFFFVYYPIVCGFFLFPSFWGRLLSYVVFCPDDSLVFTSKNNNSELSAFLEKL